MNNLINFVLAAIITLGISGCSTEEKQEERLRPVKYEEITFKGGLRKRSFTGTSQSGSEINLSFRLNGLIVMLDADIGDRVRKGTLLARLDMKDIELSYQKGKARHSQKN